MEPQGHHFVSILGTGFSLLVTDVLFYGAFAPLMGALCGAAVAQGLNIDPSYEIFLVILGVCGIFFCLFTSFRWMGLESRFWKHLFALDKGYYWILWLRDVVNIVALCYSIKLLYNSILGISEAQGMKQSNLGEGIGFVFWNGLDEFEIPIPDVIKQRYTWTPESNKSSFFTWGSSTSLAEQNLKIYHMVNGAKLVLGIACITASILKLNYFSVLHTYLRTMSIFTALQDASPPQSRGQGSLASVVSDYVSDFSFNVNSKIEPPPSDAHKQPIAAAKAS